MINLKRKTIDTSTERNLITGMIISTVFLKDVMPILKTNLIKSAFAKLIAEWCREYYEEFGEAPKATIKNIYEQKKAHLEDSTAEAISVFLTSISEEYERENFNTPYVLSQTESYLKSRSLEELAGNITAAISQGNIIEADVYRINYETVARPSSDAIDSFADDSIKAAFENTSRNVLFTLPGALGEMIRPFSRSELIAVMAPMKFGKSFFLIDWAVRAYLAGLKVLFLSLEMTAAAVNLRFYQNICGSYIQSHYEQQNDNRRNKMIDIPFINEYNEIAIKKIEKEPLTSAGVIKKMIAVKKMFHGGEVRLICRPRGTVNSVEIKNIMHIENDKSGFIPDVIIGDYFDIFGPEPGTYKDPRHMINETWGAAAALAVEHNLAFIGATQGSRINFKKDIEQGDVTEDIRKLAHVSRMIAINKGFDPSEKPEMEAMEITEIKKKHTFRLNVLVERHGGFDSERKVRVLHQLAIGKPCLGSMWDDVEEK